jgi:hypothetical protein
MTLRVLAALVAALSFGVAAARADGDPASDFLLSRDTFYPFTEKVSDDEQQRLDALVAESKKRGYPVKVAIIGTQSDLGAVPSLWRKPATYARFLGQELFFLYKGRLLIVMPNGYGVGRGGKALPAGQRVVDRLPEPGESGEALAAAAERGLRRLAASNGVQLPVVKATSSDNTTRDRLVIAGAAGLAVVALLGVGWFVRRR